jgi:hypothetical protein
LGKGRYTELTYAFRRFMGPYEPQIESATFKKEKVLGNELLLCRRES